jgi:hypothetical protein
VPTTTVHDTATKKERRKSRSVMLVSLHQHD